MSPLTNEQRDDDSTQGRLFKVEFGLDGMQRQIAQLGDVLGKLDQKIDGLTTSKPTNWGGISAVAAIVVALGTAGWSIINLNLQATTSKISSDVAQMAEAVRHEEDSTVKIYARLNGDELQIGSIGDHLTEIETQFRAQDQIANLRAADSARVLALLWEKVYGERYPEIMAYPQMGRDSSGLSIAPSSNK